MLTKSQSLCLNRTPSKQLIGNSPYSRKTRPVLIHSINHSLHKATFPQSRRITWHPQTRPTHHTLNPCVPEQLHSDDRSNTTCTVGRRATSAFAPLPKFNSQPRLNIPQFRVWPPLARDHPGRLPSLAPSPPSRPISNKIGPPPKNSPNHPTRLHPLVIHRVYYLSRHVARECNTQSGKRISPKRTCVRFVLPT